MQLPFVLAHPSTSASQRWQERPPSPHVVPGNWWLLEQVSCPVSWTWRGAGQSWVWLPPSEVQGAPQARLCLWMPKLEWLPAT